MGICEVGAAGGILALLMGAGKLIVCANVAYGVCCFVLLDEFLQPRIAQLKLACWSLDLPGAD